MKSPPKSFRVKIAIKDRHLFKGKSLDDVLQHATLRRPEWHTRIVSELGEKNIVVDSKLRVQKIRCERTFQLKNCGIEERTYQFGYEVVVRIVRSRVGRDAKATSGVVIKWQHVGVGRFKGL